MTIGQVAKRIGLRTSAIRFYETAGLLPKPVRSGGRRRYDSSVLEQLAVLRFAKQCGFTLAEISRLLNGFRDPAPLSVRMPAPARRKIAELDALMQRIAGMRKLLEAAESCACKDIQQCGRRILRRIPGAKAR